MNTQQRILNLRADWAILASITRSLKGELILLLEPTSKFKAKFGRGGRRNRRRRARRSK